MSLCFKNNHRFVINLMNEKWQMKNPNHQFYCVHRVYGIETYWLNPTVESFYGFQNRDIYNCPIYLFHFFCRLSGIKSFYSFETMHFSPKNLKLNLSFFWIFNFFGNNNCFGSKYLVVPNVFWPEHSFWTIFVDPKIIFHPKKLIGLTPIFDRKTGLISFCDQQQILDHEL